MVEDDAELLDANQQRVKLLDRLRGPDYPGKVERAIVFRLVTKEGWQWITIPPGQSKQFKDKGRKYLK